MSWSDDRSTLELISRTSDHNIINTDSDADTDTICIFIDNGRVVNSQGKVKDSRVMDAPSDEMSESRSQREQLEMIWSLVRRMSMMSREVETLRDTVSGAGHKMLGLNHSSSPGQHRAAPLKIEDYTRKITTLAAYPNGDISNNNNNNSSRVDFGEVKYYSNFAGAGVSLSSSVMAPVEADHKYAPDLSQSNRRSLLDKSSSTFNDEHSSLMTRSLVSNTMSDKPDPIHIIKSRINNKRVTLNVGGEKHEVLW